MIASDALNAPKEKITLLRLSAKDLFDYRRRTFHLKEDGDGLVVAEGEQELFSFPEGASKIGAVQGRTYAHDPSRRRMYAMKADFSGYDYTYNLTSEPYQLLRMYNPTATIDHFCVTKDHVLQYVENTTITAGRNRGGYCAAAFHDRIFTGYEDIVYFSKPYSGGNWAEKRYGAGRVCLHSDYLGGIIGMYPYKDKLYLFRRHGITALRASGDELNFKAVDLPLKCGKLVERSVALCGEMVGFFTDEGFYLFNGATSVLAKNSRFDEIDFSAGVKAYDFCGKYYALVKRKGGNAAILCYNPEREEGHFIENGATDIAVGADLLFARGTHAYKMTKKGVSENFIPYLTAEKIAFGIGKEKTLSEIAVDGEGAFCVSLTSARGTRIVKGRTNEILKLRSPLRGNGFDLKIAVAPEETDAARFRAILFRFKEEKDDD